MEGKLHIAHAALGRGRISSFSFLSEFYELSVREFAELHLHLVRLSAFYLGLIATDNDLRQNPKHVW